VRPDRRDHPEAARDGPAVPRHRGTSPRPRRVPGALDSRGVPVQPGGHTGLFSRAEAQLFGKTYAWLAGHNWSPEPYSWGGIPEDDEVISEYQDLYQLTEDRAQTVRARLLALKASVGSGAMPVNLVADYYELLADLGVATWDAEDPMVSSGLGTLARCSPILADYEAVRGRSRPDPDQPGAQIAGQDRGAWYYGNLAIYISKYAEGAYEDFDGEPDVQIDAVDLTTVHKAKGLEWRVVLRALAHQQAIPLLFDGTPAGLAGPAAPLQPGALRGLGRRRAQAVLRGYDACAGLALPVPARKDEEQGRGLAVPPRSRRAVRYHAAAASGHGADHPRGGGGALTLTFSEPASFRSCGFAYRLRGLLGFQPFLAPELGYGKAVHHIMRAVAEHTRRYGRAPTPVELQAMFDSSFFLPAASKPAPGSSRRRPDGSWTSTCGLTRMIFTGSGRPSGRSSCTCRRRSSAVAPMSSSTRRAATSQRWR
jgi:DNA helicase-2/ATP-dependent DNA helicase PcrA